MFNLITVFNILKNTCICMAVLAALSFYSCLTAKKAEMMVLNRSSMAGL